MSPHDLAAAFVGFGMVSTAVALIGLPFMFTRQVELQLIGLTLTVPFTVFMATLVFVVTR